MSSNNSSIHSSMFTEIELSAIAVGLYLLISPIHGVSKITQPILKTLNIRSATSLLFVTGFLFGIIYYYSIEYILHPVYTKLKRIDGFKVGGMTADQMNLLEAAANNYNRNNRNNR